MICDTLQHLTRYKGLCKNLDTAIDYLLTHDPASLPLGRTEVDGDTVFINVMDAELHPNEGSHPEYHRIYADLQIDLTGSEHLDWASEGTEQGEFDEENDFGLRTGPEHCGMTLGGGRFAVFFPGELHKPGVARPECTKVRKAVVKIRMEDKA